MNFYRGSDWDRVVGSMRAYGMRITNEEMQKIITHLADDGEQDDSAPMP